MANYFIFDPEEARARILRSSPTVAAAALDTLATQHGGTAAFEAVQRMSHDLNELAGENDEPYTPSFKFPRSKALIDDVALEKQDPQHRMGGILNAANEIYKQTATDKDLFGWLNSIPDLERVFLLREALGLRDRTSLKPEELRAGVREGGSLIKPSLVKAFFKGVQYLDAVTRQQYIVNIAGGQFTKNGIPFSTTDLTTCHSGRGFGIFVIDRQHNLYSASHVRGIFHHSSFTSGKNVRSAGELVIKNGRLKLLSVKSGHYRPDKEHMVYAINLFKDKGVRPEEYHVLTWDTSGHVDAIVLMRASEYIGGGSERFGVAVWGNGKPTQDQLRAIGA